MIHMKNRFLVVVCTLVISSISFGQSYDDLSGQEGLNTITTAVPFLQIAPDARAGGMADNGVATSPDAKYGNPQVPYETFSSF